MFTLHLVSDFLLLKLCDLSTIGRDLDLILEMFKVGFGLFQILCNIFSNIYKEKMLQEGDVTDNREIFSTILR